MIIKQEDNRINSIDALRGFALAGILFSHMVEQFIAGGPSLEIKEVMLSTDLSFYIERTVHWLIQGKFFALFAMLFGVSYSIQLKSGLQRSSNFSFSVRYVWRVFILLIIGIGHHLLYSGDILSIFAPIALFLLLFNKLNNKWLLFFALIFLFGGGRYLRFWAMGHVDLLPSFPIEGLHEKYLDALRNGSILDVAYFNVFRFSGKWNYQLGVVGRAFLTFGYFLFGFWVGRNSFFEKMNNKILYVLVSIFSLVCIMYFLIPESVFSSEDVDLNGWLKMFKITFLDLFNTSLTLLIASVFLLLYLNRRQFFTFFESYGRMALSNYLIQSFICICILYNWGLGYIGELSNAQTLIITCSVIFLQVLYSNWWMKRFYFGPLEWFWRSLTYFKIQKFKR